MQYTHIYITEYQLVSDHKVTDCNFDWHITTICASVDSYATLTDSDMIISFMSTHSSVTFGSNTHRLIIGLLQLNSNIDASVGGRWSYTFVS